MNSANVTMPSENYVRTQQRLTATFGSTQSAMAASHFVSGVQYLAAAANVMLFARAVDPGQQLVENSAAALVAFDLRERTMAMLHVVVRRLALPAVLLLVSALVLAQKAIRPRNRFAVEERDQRYSALTRAPLSCGRELPA